MWFQYLTREIFQKRLQGICKDILRKKGAEDFHSLWEGSFLLWFSPVHALETAELDRLRHKILNNPLAWLIMTLHNSYFISFLFSLYLPSVFMIKPLDELSLSAARLPLTRLHNPFWLLGLLDSLPLPCLNAQHLEKNRKNFQLTPGYMSHRINFPWCMLEMFLKTLLGKTGQMSEAHHRLKAQF